MRSIFILLFALCSVLVFSKEPSNKQKEESFIVTATPDTYDEITKNGVVLVDFWAAWCGPCRMLNPVLEQVAKERKTKVTIAKLNTEEFHDFSIKMSVFSLPSILIYKDGKYITRAEGLVEKATLLEVIDYLDSVRN